MKQKDMIHGVLLRRDFPLARLLEKFEDAFSWPGKTENRQRIFLSYRKSYLLNLIFTMHS